MIAWLLLVTSQIRMKVNLWKKIKAVFNAFWEIASLPIQLFTKNDNETHRPQLLSDPSKLPSPTQQSLETWESQNQNSSVFNCARYSYFQLLVNVRVTGTLVSPH